MMMGNTLRIFLAALAVLAGCAVPATAAQQKAGVAAAVTGDVQLSRLPEVVGKRVESGEPIFLDDKISSGPGAGLQILLLDETVFTIGPGSEITIDTFVYDPANDTGKVAAKVTKGVFRFITGRVAQKAPRNMEVKVPFGTIGVRGTIVAGRVDADGAEVVLLGPGTANNTTENVGRIEVSNAQGVVALTRPGFGTTLGAGVPPTPPALVPGARRQALTNTLSASQRPGGPRPPGAPPPGGGEEGAPPPPGGEGATEGTAPEGGGELTTMPPPPGAGPGSLGGGDISGGQQPPPPPPGTFPDGITTLSELQKAPSGIFNYSQTNVPITGGQYEIYYRIDFGNQQVGGGDSRISGNSVVGGFTTGGGGNPYVPLNAQNFSAGINDNAQFNYTNVPFDGANQMDVSITFKNANGGLAELMDHSVNVTTGATASGSGSALRGKGAPPPP